jgi:ABC-2 type transport system ATP-binding protein
MDAIATQGLTKAYRSHLGRIKLRALDDLHLTVRSNEVYGFLGRNGAGKTTTIKILCSLLRASAGEARIFGDPVRSRASRRHIGYLPENPYFYEYLTPRETIDFYGRLHGLDVASRGKQWLKLRDMLELGELADRRVRGFSKGQRQRLGFAVALVGNPEILILDEPMSGLDPLGRRNIRELILRCRDEKKTLFFSSHVLGDVEQICDKVAIVVQGKLRSHGPISELLSQRIARVEVIIRGLSEGDAQRFSASAEHIRQSEIGHHFVMADADGADRLVQDAHGEGGKLVEFTPIKESLEDYFMSQQGAQP